MRENEGEKWGAEKGSKKEREGGRKGGSDHAP